MFNENEMFSPQSMNDFFQNMLESNGEIVNEFMRLAQKDPNFNAGLDLSPDTYGADQLFLEFFINPEMKDDFPLIAKDFYEHELTSIKEYENVEYLSIDTGDDYPGRMFERFTLSLMLNAYNSGSEYTKALLIHLYKTYYKKEYKQLKRFTSLSATELISLAKPEDEYGAYTANLARILTISKIIGLKINDNCSFIYGFLNNFSEKVMQSVKRESFETTDEEYDSCQNEIESYDLKKLYNHDHRANRFISNVLKWYGYTPEYVDFCDNYEGALEDRLTLTLLLLKKTYPTRTFTEKEIVIYSEIFHCIGALISGSDWLNVTMSILAYGKDATYRYDDYPSLFKPEDLKPNEKPKEINVIDKTRKPANVSDQTNPVLKEEIETLRRKVHKLESDNNSLRNELTEKRKLEDEVKNLKKNYENANRELAALRDFAYRQTNEEITEAKISTDQMRKYLNSRHILIIGGHTKWVAKMKETFPDWVFINPDASGTVDVSVVNKADHIYFFTDTISHSKYYQFMNVVRERKIDFGYIHGVNIDKTIEYIYNDLNDE